MNEQRVLEQTTSTRIQLELLNFFARMSFLINNFSLLTISYSSSNTNYIDLNGC